METKKKKAFLQTVATAMKKNKKLEYGVYAGIALIIIALYAGTLFPEKKAEPTKEEPAANANDEERLGEVLSNIRGAGRVEVMITYETGPELVPAMNTDTTTNQSETSGGSSANSSTFSQSQSQKPALNAGGGEPIVLTEKLPAVRGVIVIAEGADEIAVKLSLQRAVQTVLDVPIAKIEVFAAEKNNNQ